jgi:hypothetical protein
MLVDKLRMTVAPEQQAEIVEPGNNSLQLYSVDQKNRQWRFGFTNVIKEGVLQILCAVGRHCCCPACVSFYLPAA